MDGVKAGLWIADRLIQDRHQSLLFPPTEREPDTMEQTTEPTIIDNPNEAEELALFLVLKPLIGRCLALNHDINNPLAGIIGYCEFLQLESDGFSKEQIGFLKQIQTCSERIQKLVEEVCVEKIHLSKKVDLKSVTEWFEKEADQSD